MPPRTRNFLEDFGKSKERTEHEEPGPSGVNHLIKYHGVPPAQPKIDLAPTNSRKIELFKPSKVSLELPGGRSFDAWAINPLCVIGRMQDLAPGYVIRSYRSSNPLDSFKFVHRIMRDNFDINLGIFAFELQHPIKLSRPTGGALRDYSDDALHFAEGVANAIILSRYGYPPRS